jgi:hypothetical protein
MTDRERLLELLASFGIVPSTSKYLPDEYLAGLHVVLYEATAASPDTRTTSVHSPSTTAADSCGSRSATSS